MMGPRKLPTLRALLANVGTGAWHWRADDLTSQPHIWQLVHPGAVNAVNVFAYGPPLSLSLQARVIAALHPDFLHEVREGEWAAQEARERLVMAQGLLHIVLADAGPCDRNRASWRGWWPASSVLPQCSWLRNRPR
jgi:hypothetical protein